MERCKTCIHWRYDPKDDDAWRVDRYCAPHDQDTFEPMQMPFAVRECKHPALTFCERPVEPNGFGVADGSEYMAALLTAGDFGCVRHVRALPASGD